MDRNGKFNSDNHYIYYCGQESLRRNAVVLTVNKRVQNSVLGCNVKTKNALGSFLRQTIQNNNNPSLMPNKMKSNNSMKTYKTF